MIFVHVLCGLLPQAGWFPLRPIVYHSSIHSWFTAVWKRTPSVLYVLVCCYVIWTHTYKRHQILHLTTFDELQQMMQQHAIPHLFESSCFKGFFSVIVHSDRQARIKNTEACMWGPHLLTATCMCVTTGLNQCDLTQQQALCNKLVRF